MARFLGYLFIGLSSGAIYSLLALGLVIVYRGSGHLNFAQGEMAMVSAWEVTGSPTLDHSSAPLSD